MLFVFLFFVPKIICQATADKVINTCGKLDYVQPENSDECKEDGEMCCFVEIKDSTFTDNNGVRRFCVSSPSDIELDDVKDDIKKYTGYEITVVKCNESQFIMNNILIIFALFVFMLF